MSAQRRLLLVRHGLPDYRNRLPSDVLPGPPLSDLGRLQARQVAEQLPRFDPQRMYVSPLTRTCQTADEIRRQIGCPVRIDSRLREWHRTERLHEVGARLAGWLIDWLRSEDQCTVVVSHASPLLAILRSALYLPHENWHKPGQPDVLELSSADRFEVSMASLFEIVVTPRTVTARRLFHPAPRVQYEHAGVRQACLPRPLVGSGENDCVERPNLLHLLGYRLAARR